MFLIIIVIDMKRNYRVHIIHLRCMILEDVRTPKIDMHIKLRFYFIVYVEEFFNK